jgi:hypothetical protein
METLFKKSLLLNSFTPTREWRNGRRAGLRIQCRKAWGFKSPLSHFRLSLTMRGARAIASAPFWVCVLLFGDQFDATVLRASFGSIVGRYEVGLAVAVRM